MAPQISPEVLKNRKTVKITWVNGGWVITKCRHVMMLQRQAAKNTGRIAESGGEHHRRTVQLRQSGRKVQPAAIAV